MRPEFMAKTLIFAGIAAFIVSVIAGRLIIPVLRRIKAGQTEREDGPESHLKKAGTPVMGGFIFLISSTLVGLFFIKDCKEMIPMLILTWVFAGIGFIDDYIKVVLKRSLGLRAWQKLVLQTIAATAFSLYLYFMDGYEFSSLIPFMAGKSVNFGVFSVPICVFIIVGTANGSNFTDGVDGLESSVTTAILGFLLAIGLVLKSDLPVVCAVFMGSLMGFLVYNVYKAKVFMGDTGSLALGGLVSGIALLLHLELFLPIIAVIYFVEVLSVIIQVLYFKATHGKRIFRMTPIHHHFELGGWTETKVVYMFTLVTILLCAVSFALFV